MFQELYGVARHTPLTIIITPQGDKLSVIVTPRPDKAGAKEGELSKPIQAIGTPAELDAELPAKLREYAAAVNGLRTKLELPTASITAKTAKAKPARSTPKAKKAPAPKPKKAAKPKPAKKPVKAKAAKKAAPKPRVQLPGAAKAKKPAKSAPTPRAGLPTREDLVVACRALIAKHGVVKIDREFFIKHVKSGRRYERLFTTFKEMVASAQKPAAAEKAPRTSPAEKDGSPPESGQTEVHQSPGETSPTVLHTGGDKALEWPFPTTSRA